MLVNVQAKRGVGKSLWPVMGLLLFTCVSVYIELLLVVFSVSFGVSPAAFRTPDGVALGVDLPADWVAEIPVVLRDVREPDLMFSRD